jgi:hypothetical protein
VKKQLQKSEMLIKFDQKDIGYLVALSVGHKDKPNDSEIQQIRSVMQKSNFKYIKEDFSQIGDENVTYQK